MVRVKTQQTSKKSLETDTCNKEDQNIYMYMLVAQVNFVPEGSYLGFLPDI